MGCGASQPRQLSVVYAGDGTGHLVHSSRKSYANVPLVQMYKKIEDELVQEIQERRGNRQAATQRLIAARGAQGLQARGSLMSIFSTAANVFEEFLADCPEYIDLPTFGSMAGNAIPGSFMLFRANEVQETVEGRGGGSGGPPLPPNAPLLGAPLQNILRFKALWGSRLLAVTLLVVQHPALGRVAVVQPMLLAACMQRVFNWAPEVDPVFDVVLKAGASPHARNSLNMTALMLLANSLASELDNYANYSGAEELAGKVQQAVVVASTTARMLLDAGADPAAEMRGFGAAWSTTATDLSFPGVLRCVQHVVHLERYTAHEAFGLMLAPLRDQINAAGPATVELLDSFAELLRPRPAAHAAAGPGPDAGDAEAEGRQAADGLESQPGTAGFREEGAAQRPAECGMSSGGGAGEDSTAEGAPEPGGPLAPAKSSSQAVPSEAAAQRRLQQQPQRPRPSASDMTWPWVQAMSNIVWAVSQVTLVQTARERRSFLRHLQLQSPFFLPPMSVVSLAQLHQEGRIPRFSLQDLAGDPQATSSAPFQPLCVDALPPSAVVVFVSHRWLGRGCPDDERGTKLKQVLSIADHVAEHRGVSVEQVYLWLDYSVVDQSNPMPGVQALPIYIACCEEFVYVMHEEYWQRAWCLTEQFMHWKLATSDVKHVLQPDSMTMTTESSREQPPDPTYGKLAVEADRVALATMTSILPYDVQ